MHTHESTSNQKNYLITVISSYFHHCKLLLYCYYFTPCLQLTINFINIHVTIDLTEHHKSSPRSVFCSDSNKLTWLIKLSPYLFQDPGSHLMSTIKDDMELLRLLHLLQKWLGVLGLCGQLSDLQTNVVSRWRLDQLLQSNETCRQRGYI